ncbi:DUF2461 domain-containing protein [Cyclobacterium sp.]|uniref:DUF2461 domain-containing protein n=1 Tax=Cyclobacterium sp. TaxID=1966343 RepID=UPI0019B437F2|nr:DUF2461 domain-containing protein [Cyclobacterium sp.]MBD3630074.1 DUF2461 domain-containing protein [Cyclobacterium sp.]
MKNTPILHFLEELTQNNSKDWMDANRDWYLQVKERLLEDVAEILSALSERQPLFSELRPKDCIFRQNRDVRFSANKQPYKTNMAAYFAIGGKKSAGPGYYLHLQPGGSFVGGGIYMPAAETLKKIRQEIDYSGEELDNILHRPEFHSFFGDMEGEQLKTSPRDYDKDHPYLKYLKYKSFIVSKPVSDQEIHSGNYVKQAISAFEMMLPFYEFLERAIGTTEDEAFLL